jgi:hypothetical protein
MNRTETGKNVGQYQFEVATQAIATLQRRY